jgi:PKD repeat protein
LTIVDHLGAVGQDSLQVTIVNRPPVVNAGGDQDVDEDAQVHFAGSFTDPDAGDSHTITWDFGDGSPVVTGTLTPIHAFASPGNYTVTLTVTYDHNVAVSDSLMVTVSNVVPVADAGPDQSATVNLPVQFNGSFTDGDQGDTHTISWNFGDGSPAVTGTLTPTHAFAAPGLYTVTLTITDSDGGVDDDTMQVHVIGGGVQQPPVLGAIGDRSMTVNGSLMITLAATDPNGDPLTYDAAAESLESFYDRTLGLFTRGNLYFNFGGLQEKWIEGAGGQWYYITPDGSFYHWHGGATTNATLVDVLLPADWADPSRLHNGQSVPAQATIGVAGDTLTVTPTAGFIGAFLVTASVNDGQGGSDSETFRVLVRASDPPVLTPIGDQQVLSNQDSIDVILSATDPNNDPLTFSASAQSLAYHLDQTLGLFTTGNLYQNFGGLNEKWLQGNGGKWYYITPDGRFFEWKGGAVGPADTLLEQLDPALWTNPALLYNAPANAAPAELTLNGTTLNINPNNGFVGQFVVTVSVSDGMGGADSETFRVSAMPSQPPVLTPIADQTMPTSQDVLALLLQATDPDGDPVTFAATTRSLAYHLDQSLGLFSNGNLWFNFGGLQEKWIEGSGGQWYYITPDGKFYRWLGGAATNAALVDQLATSYYANPSMLYNAQPGGVPATVSINGSTLMIDPDAGFVGSFFITVEASNGHGGVATTTFRVNVTAT